MSADELASVRADRGVTVRGMENFVTQDRRYIEPLIGHSPAGRYDNIVRFETRPGTHDAMVDVGGTSRSNLIDNHPVYGELPRIESGNTHQVHIKGERQVRQLRPAAATARTSSTTAFRASDDNCAEFDERLRSFAWVDAPKMADWLREQRGVEPCVAEGLRQCRERDDWDGFERYVSAADIHPSPAYIETLGEVLDERREDINNEDDRRRAQPHPRSRRRAVPAPRHPVHPGDGRVRPARPQGGLGARPDPHARGARGDPRRGQPDLPDNVVEAAQEALAR